MSITSTVRANALEFQFWGYELGNVVAAITGAGGFALFMGETLRAFSQLGLIAGYAHLLVTHAEVAATLGVLLLVVLASPVAALARRFLGNTASAAVSVLVAALALSLLGYAVVAQTSFFTLAACCFVLGSSLLRSADEMPVMLKLGGLCLTAGGLALSAAGLTMFGGSAHALSLALLTFLSGLYVAGAGLLTYRGGVFVATDWVADRA